MIATKNFLKSSLQNHQQRWYYRDVDLLIGTAKVTKTCADCHKEIPAGHKLACGNHHFYCLDCVIEIPDNLMYQKCPDARPFEVMKKRLETLAEELDNPFLENADEIIAEMAEIDQCLATFSVETYYAKSNSRSTAK